MKFSKTHEKQLREFMEVMDADGCVTIDKWTSGSGRYTANKVLPQFVERFERKEYAPTALPKRGTTERVAYEFFRKNAARKVVLVLDKVAFADFVFENIHGKEF